MISSEIVEYDGFPVAIIHLNERMEVFSSAVYNGGTTETDTLFIMEVSKNYMHDNPPEHADSVRSALGLPSDAVGFMTAAEVKYVFSNTKTDYEGMKTEAFVTAGLSNHVIAGELLKDWAKRSRISAERAANLAGTINIIAISPVALSEIGKINLMLPITEAKSAAMHYMGYEETGTTSDAVAIVSPISEDRVGYSGTGTTLGISVARSVRDGVCEALVKRGDYPVPLTLMELLSSVGISPELIWKESLDCVQSLNHVVYMEMFEDLESNGVVKDTTEALISLQKSYDQKRLSSYDFNNLPEELGKLIAKSISNSSENYITISNLISKDLGVFISPIISGIISGLTEKYMEE